MQSTLYPESVVFSTAFTVCFLSDLLFFSIQQKKRLEWLGSIHFKPIKALIRNHTFRKQVEKETRKELRSCSVAGYLMYFTSFLPKI